MSRPDPLVAEVWHGLGESGPAQLAQLNYLAIQAVVLFAWWTYGAIWFVAFVWFVPPVLDRLRGSRPSAVEPDPSPGDPEEMSPE